MLSRDLENIERSWTRLELLRHSHESLVAASSTGCRVPRNPVTVSVFEATAPLPCHLDKFTLVHVRPGSLEAREKVPDAPEFRIWLLMQAPLEPLPTLQTLPNARPTTFCANGRSPAFETALWRFHPMGEIWGCLPAPRADVPLYVMARQGSSYLSPEIRPN